MLFNTLTFWLLFAPLSFLVLCLLARKNNRAAVSWLGFASLAFYAWSELRYLPLLLGSILLNYLVGQLILAALAKNRGPLGPRHWMLIGVGANLALLGYFKYAGLFQTSLAHWLPGFAPGFVPPALPIGISFFTFTQIAFLVDSAAGKVKHNELSRYFLFVTFFPHLIAGPILHHASMMPQFGARSFGRFSAADVCAGLLIFCVGLVKKVVLADSVSEFVTPIFGAADAGFALGTGEAWVGVLAYTFQIYFDFSGYTDMAIGLSRMMGIALPENFNSPYNATSISDFWRRWHISLSTFLRDYLYIALGGNRRGPARRHLNLMATMLLGGLWHGASWNFMVWGGLHGLYLVINHVWRQWFPPSAAGPGWPGRLCGWAVTMVAVAFAWVFFRASSFDSAFLVIDAMLGHAAGKTGHVVPYDTQRAIAWILVCAAVALLAPNTVALRARFGPLVQRLPVADAQRMRGLLIGGMLVLCTLLIVMSESAVGRSPFIYFNF